MNLAKLALAAAVLVAPVAAHAQDVGTTVFGNDDAAVGTVTANADGVVTVDTGKHKAPLPANLLAEREGKWTVNATKAQIDGMIDAQLAKATAARDAALIVGAEAMDAEHAALGTVVEIDGDNIVLARGGDETDKVTLPREYFVAMDGMLMARLTNAQIDAAMAQSAAGSNSAGE